MPHSHSQQPPQSQSITLPEEINKNHDFLLRMSQSNEKVYTHVEYLKHLVQSMYEMYRKMSKSVVRLSEDYEKKLARLNDSTALSILNFIRGLEKLFQNIKEQLGNNTVNLNKKSQKVSRTRKDIIYQKLIKINQLFVVYLQKVQKFNKKQTEYREKCQYFHSIETDTIKFYSTKENKLLFEQLIKLQSSMQEQLEETYSLKIELKSGLNEIRLSLKEFFEMLGNNAQDDKKLLLSVRKKLKETKIFNETIIEEVNSQAEESVTPGNEGGSHRYSKGHYQGNGVQEQLNGNNIYDNNSPDHVDQHSFLKQQSNLTLSPSNSPKSSSQRQQHTTFSPLPNTTTIAQDVKQIIQNLQVQEYCIETFCEFASIFQRQIIQNGDIIDKLRNSTQYMKFNDKKFQINELLTTDMMYNTEAVKNEIADIRQVIESVKALLDKKKVINELKKYRSIKYEKFLSETETFIELQKKAQNHEHARELRQKYKQHKQKFAKGHLQLMTRFREMVQDIFKQINEKFKFQRNPQLESRRTKNQFIKKRYFSLLMLTFFVNKEEPPKFQINCWLKGYEKFLSQESLKRVGLVEGDERDSKKGWGCCGMVMIGGVKAQKNKYIDEYNCALKNGIVLIQGKMKIHQNYLKFVSSFNAKTIFGETNLRVPKWDIESIEKKYVLLSLVVVINTTRGQLSFTSFLSDPHKKLLDIYENKDPLRKTQQKTLTIDRQQHSPFEQKVTQKTQNETFTLPNNSRTPNYIRELQEKFQSELPELIDKQIINFQSLSTYLAESHKELSISVQYNLITNKEKKYFFEIKIADDKNKIQYKFVHEKSMEDEKIKKMLEQMATKIINGKLPPSSPKRLHMSDDKKGMYDVDNQRKSFSPINISRVSCSKRQQDRIFQDSYSFIQRKQCNQFQFDKDPSFVYVKQPSVAHGGDPSFNYEPDLLIFRNMDSERKVEYCPMDGKNNSFASEGRRSKGSVSKEEIDEYLNSIDEKDIRKNMVRSKSAIAKRAHEKNMSSTLDSYKSSTPTSPLNITNLILFLIIIVGLNVLISVLK